MRAARWAMAMAMAVLALGALPAPAAHARARQGTADEVAQQAGRALVAEAGQLLALGALDDPNGRLPRVLGTLPAPDTAALQAADDQGAAALAKLITLVPEPSADVRAALQPLSDADRAAAADGRAISLTSETYLRAFDHLQSTDGGRPATSAPPDLPAITAWIAGLGTAPPPTTTAAPTTTEPSSTTAAPSTTEAVPTPTTTSAAGDGDAGGGGLPWWPLVAAVVVVGGGVAAWLLGGRRSVPPTPATAATVDQLLEVSRRLTAAPAEEIDRAVVREALGLVPADGAALVHQHDDGLSVGHESRPGLLVPAGLDEGLVRRVADTGQRIVQVSATEPALANLPAALVSVPLVGGGRVEAVLILVRDGSRPFTNAEAALLSAMAPVAAAALHSSRTARAAIEDSLVDGLTGVGNRRRFDLELAATLADGVEHRATTALAILDLDHFKAVNDRHGHPAGDAVLVAVAELLRTSIRPQDRAYRFGGEEFCVVMVASDPATAGEVAERVRAAVEAHPFAIGGPEPLRCTASIGVAATTGPDPADLVARADAALYEAKGSGRNRVVTAP